MPDTETLAADQPAKTTRSRRRLLLLLGIPLVVLLVVGGAVWWFFIRDDSPDSPDIDDARATIDERQESDDPDAAAGDVDGTWTVDPEIGSFDDFSGTYAGYRIGEELASVGTTEAVGRTPDVTGEVVIEGDQVTSAAFEVDMTTLESNESMRDGRLESQGLETDSFPTASFELTEPLDLPAEAASGEELAYEAVGDLTLHGETREVTVSLDAVLTDDVLAVVVNPVEIVLADYGIEKPSGIGVVGIEDEGDFELQAFLAR